LIRSSLRLFRLAADSLKGGFKRENEIDINFFSSINGLADQALRYGLTILLFNPSTQQSHFFIPMLDSSQ
jgi:hypothetical protein